MIEFRCDRFMRLTYAAVENAPEQTATRDDISRVIKSMELRDQRILSLEYNLNKLTEEHRRLREELVRLAKPLPHPNAQSPDHFIDTDERSPYPQMPDTSKSLSRKSSLSTGSLGHTKNQITISQSFLTQFSPGKKMDIDIITASHNPIQQSAPSPREPRENSAPTSPVNYVNQVAGQRNHPQTPNMGSTANLPNYPSDRDRIPTAPPPGNPARPPRSAYQPSEDPPSAGAREPSVEIFKSFRVSMEDPCEKVLPAALKKYNINADWKNYALYIVYGDQERCLGLKEKPLILFKQLDKEGRKPMFMLRRHAAPLEGHSGPSGIGGGGAGGGFGGGSSGYDQLRAHQSSIQLPQLPGGVL